MFDTQATASVTDAGEPSAASARLSRRRFIGATAGAAGGLALLRFAPSAFAAPADELLQKSVVEIAALLKAGKVSAVELVQRCYARIDAVNPQINAVVATCRERAYAEAAEADALLAAGKTRGPLHGVPFTVKDSFDTAGLVSTGGTLGRKDFVPGKDATVVARARAAGAILLGKTNTPEFTLGGGGKGTVNLVYGLTRNPYNTAYQPSGSSGGAGAIVAACGAYFDIGSDYGGSIRGPAFANGIAGIKPTYGRVPRTGHIVGYGGPFDNFQETGPLAREVGDLALLLPILAGPDGRDAAMAPVPLGDPAKVALGQLRIAWYVSNGQMPASEEMQTLVRQCVGYFEKLGCTIRQDAPPKMKELAAARSTFSGADGRAYMRRLLAQHGTRQASPGLRLDGAVISAAEFTAACEQMDAIKSEQLAWLAQYDLIVCPASQRAPIPLDWMPPGGREARSGMSYTSQYNTTGWPAGVVRAGTSAKDAPGLPIGIQIVGQPWRDDVVLAALAHIEKQTGGWIAPSI
ncbi:amidase [Solimonas flava]|uniref:amidase n=1 Tax=Solimonas flava TaxID=415849 RepID=UPI00041470E4|nr:amidase [Solimonas flava]